MRVLADVVCCGEVVCMTMKEGEKMITTEDLRNVLEVLADNTEVRVNDSIDFKIEFDLNTDIPSVNFINKKTV